MAELFVFADETGTMPEREGDGPFCAATLSMLGEVPSVETRSGQFNDLVKFIDEAAALPKIAYVLPREGFEQTVRSKTSKMNTMARATRLMMGANAYFPGCGHNLRNTVWGRCMGTSLCSAVLFGVEKGPVDGIQIVLDQKTMAKQTRHMFIDSVLQVVLDLRAHIAEVERRTETGAPFRDNVRFEGGDVKVTWSDEGIPDEWEDGIFLADRLGYHTYRALLRGALEHLSAQLDRFVPTEVFYDATNEVTAPISSEAIEEWKRRTGLPEPSE